MKRTIFKGIATALVTPLDENGVNYDQLGRLIDWQIEQGINGLVACGTTGESATLTEKEHMEVIDYAIKRVAGRVPLIAGTGSNSTATAIELTQHAADAGADAALLVTPYYNKATQKGLVQMYNEIADASDIPLIVYNVPSRTGVAIAPATYAAMAEHPNIVAIKEASGDLSGIVETAALLGGKLDMYSGNDDQIVPILSMGGMGCISVFSNVMPAAAVELCNRFFDGDVQGAAALQCKYNKLMKILFCEVNPIPVKAAVAAMGFCKNYLRSPLYPMESAHYAQLIAEMREQGLNV